MGWHPVPPAFNRRERDAKGCVPLKTAENSVDGPGAAKGIESRIPDPRPTPTAMLLAWNRGEPEALEALMPLVVRRAAPARGAISARRARGPHAAGDGARQRGVSAAHRGPERFNGRTGRTSSHWQHELMRRILVDAARARGYQKRGGGVRALSLDEALIVAVEPARRTRGARRRPDGVGNGGPRKSQVVEMRFFGGLSIDETAEALNVSRGHSQA